MALDMSSSKILSNGQSMPIVGFGTWRTIKSETYEAVRQALKAGYRHIDTAYYYQNEVEVGKAIRDGMVELGLARRDIFVVTKLPSTCNRPSLVIPAMKESRTSLGLSYVDLYLVHTPVATVPNIPDKVSLDEKIGPDGGRINDDEVCITDLWKQMENCVTMGLALSVGVSNFNSLQLQEILDCCTIKPVTNQVECHPLLQQNKLRDFCEKHDIVLTAFRCLGGQVKKPEDPDLLKIQEITNLAVKYRKSPAQILLKWQIEKGNIFLVKSSNASRIAENSQIFDFSLLKEELEELAKLDVGHRYCPFTDTKESKHYPFHIEF